MRTEEEIIASAALRGLAGLARRNREVQPAVLDALGALLGREWLDRQLAQIAAEELVSLDDARGATLHDEIASAHPERARILRAVLDSAAGR